MRSKSKRDITMAIIEHDMHVVFSLAQKISVLAQGHGDRRRHCRRTSKGIRRCRKPTLAPRIRNGALKLNDDTMEKNANRAELPERTAYILCLWDVHAYYGESYVVQGISNEHP